MKEEKAKSSRVQPYVPPPQDQASFDEVDLNVEQATQRKEASML
mgnify:CR=1 FL=1